MKYLRKYNEAININSTSIQDIIDDYQFRTDGYLPKVLNVLEMIKDRLYDEYIVLKFDNTIVEDLRKLGFDVDTFEKENMMRIDWLKE